MNTEITIRDPLLPDRHPQQDLFICDIMDAAPKGDMGSMEHPIFSLKGGKDMTSRRYESGANYISVKPSSDGLATVHDRDVLIYCVSQAMAALNEGRKVDRVMRFKARDLLIATNRGVSGRDYELLKTAFLRLQGTQIETNIRQGDKDHFHAFSLIDSIQIVKETRDGRMQNVEVTLSDWIFDAIDNKNVLTLHRDYFRLRKPLERRLYEIARKHCGKQNKWSIRLLSLRDKCGSTSKLYEFRRLLGKIIAADEERDHMPDYSIVIEDDLVTFRPKVIDRLQGRFIKQETYEHVRVLIPGCDVHALETEWRHGVSVRQINVNNIDRHYLAFCLKKHSGEDDQ